MKKLLAIFCYAVLSITVLYLAGCKKMLDYIRQHPEGTVIVPCAINDIEYEGPFQPFVDTVTFSYDRLGNPVSAVRKHVATGSPNVLFQYDYFYRLNNLICHYGSDISGGVEGWIKYFYGAGDRVLWDSVYSFPIIVNGQPTLGEFTGAWVDTYEYDAIGRIIKTTKIASGHVPVDNNYAYDANGNLVTGYTYDDSVNLHRTNRIWQFLDRDYSLNNPLTANYEYSSVGLPLAMDVSIPSMRFMEVVLSAYVYTGNNIHYVCQ
jgi:hypothetical protein